MTEVKRYPFTLPDGTNVLVRAYGVEDHTAVNRWIRLKYMENVREACIGLGEQEKMELRLAALSRAATLTFQEGEGRDILLSDIQGFARLGYQLIDNPTLTFDEYFKTIYPDGILTEDGLKNIIDMMNAAYGGEPEIPVDSGDAVKEGEETVETESGNDGRTGEV